MKKLLKRKLAIPLAVAALLGGGAAAFAATQSSSPRRQAYLDDAAHRLGVSPAALDGALQAAAIDRVNAQLAAGHLTQAQANALEQRIKEGRGPLPGRRGLAGRRTRKGARLGLIHAAATYLGLTPAQLRAERRAGKSLDQIASATAGKSPAGLQSAIVSQAKARLGASVSSGHISSSRATELLNRLTARLPALLAATPASHTAGHGRTGHAQPLF